MVDDPEPVNAFKLVGQEKICDINSKRGKLFAHIYPAYHSQRFEKLESAFG